MQDTLKQQLAERGFRLRRIIHLRNLTEQAKSLPLPAQPLPDHALKALNLGGLIDPRGGATVAVVEHLETGRVADAVAECHSKDGYNRKEGRRIAIERAIQRLLA